VPARLHCCVCAECPRTRHACAARRCSTRDLASRGASSNRASLSVRRTPTSRRSWDSSSTDASYG
jgi:hypothetical protein